MSHGPFEVVVLAKHGRPNHFVVKCRRVQLRCRLSWQRTADLGMFVSSMFDGNAVVV